MNLKTLQKDGLIIALDLDFLAIQRDNLLKMDKIYFEYLSNSKGQPVDEAELETAVDRLYNLALDIMDEKLNIDIFEYIPLTKSGKFHKAGSTLLATSGIKNVWNGDYFSLKTLDLRLNPISYAEKINPFVAIGQTGNIFGKVTGDGDVAYIELEWHSTGTKEEQAVFDGGNNAIKVEKKRNKYLKLEDMKPGYTYFDAKGNEFLYAGNINYETKDCGSCYKDKESYLNSSKRKKEMKRNEEYISNGYNPYSHFYLKITKKSEKMIEQAGTIDKLFMMYIHEHHMNWLMEAHGFNRERK